MAARRVTLARSPDTCSPSTNILRPGTGSGGWNSISSCQCPSARAGWGTATTANARAATASTASHDLRCLVSCLVLSLSSRLRRLPSQPWGRRGLRPLRRSPSFRFFLFSLRRPPQAASCPPRHEAEGAWPALRGRGGARLPALSAVRAGVQARCGSAGPEARRSAAPPARTAEGRRPPGAAAFLLSFPRWPRRPRAPGRRLWPCEPPRGRRGRSCTRRRTGRTPPSSPRPGGR